MSKITIVLLIILAILIAAMIALYFIGQRLQKKQDEMIEKCAEHGITLL